MPTVTISTINLFYKLSAGIKKFRWIVKIEISEGSSLTKRVRREGSVFYIDLRRSPGSTTVFDNYAATNYGDSNAGCDTLVLRVIEADGSVPGTKTVYTKNAEDEGTGS